MNNLKYIFILIIVSINIFAKNDLKIVLTIQEKEWIKNNTISIGVEQWEPMVFLNKQNKIDGIAGDIIKLIIKRLNLKVKIIPNKWDFLLQEFQKGNIDLLPATYYTKERATYGLYSKEYFKMKEYIYVKIGNNSITNFNDLKGKKIAIIKDYGTIPKIREKYPSIEIIETKNMEESVKFVLEEKVDALIDAQIGVENFISKNVVVGLKGISQDSFKASPLYFFSHIKKHILKSILEKGLDSITFLEKKAIVKKWLNRENTIFNKNLRFTKEEKKYLQNKKVLKICVDPDWMPFDAIINGKHTGLASNYMDLIGKKMGVPIKLLITDSWSETLLKAKKRQCDIIPIISKTDNRKLYLDFTSSYIDVPIVIATKNTNIYIENISQIIDRRIAIVKDYSIGIYLKKDYPHIKILEVNSIEEGLKAVERGKAFAYIDNLASINYEIQKNFSGNIRISGRLEKRIKYGSATRNDEKILNTIIQKTIDNIDNHTKKDIFNRWATLTIKTNTDYTLVLQILLIVSIIFLAFIYKQHVLKKHNKELEEEIAKAVEETRQKEKILQEQSRLAQMGEMISMIAHQWRQPLGAISSSIIGIQNKIAIGKFDLGDAKDKDRFLSFLEKKHNGINGYVQFLSTTIDDFRNFFKPDKQKELIDITLPIKRALSIVKVSMSSKGIEIESNFENNDEIKVYQNELMQVILNILKNSEDNFKEKNIRNGKVILKTFKEDKKYILSMSDNGGGIELDIIKKIFNPYFSTKNEKNGTGLGLYMSKIIIEEHHKGKLTANNIDGGVEFKIVLNRDI